MCFSSFTAIIGYPFIGFLLCNGFELSKMPAFIVDNFKSMSGMFKPKSFPLYLTMDNSGSSSQVGGQNPQPGSLTQSTYKSPIVDGKHLEFEANLSRSCLEKLDNMLHSVVVGGGSKNLFSVSGVVGDLSRSERDYIFRVLTQTSNETDKFLLKGYPDMPSKYYTSMVYSLNKGHILVLSDRTPGKYTTFSNSPRNLEYVRNAIIQYDNQRIINNNSNNNNHNNN